MQQNKIADFILRAGLAFAFLYPAINAYSDPYSWLGYFPSFILDFVPNPIILLHTFGVVEIIIALWLLSNRRVYIPATLAAFMLLSIVSFNFSQIQILFRDLALATIALALTITHWPKKGGV